MVVTPIIHQTTAQYTCVTVLVYEVKRYRFYLKWMAVSHDFQRDVLSLQVDHFSFTNRDTFNMKYLYNMEYWDRESGPILFYCGNEGPAEIFAENTVGMRQ